MFINLLKKAKKIESISKRKGILVMGNAFTAYNDYDTSRSAETVVGETVLRSESFKEMTVWTGAVEATTIQYTLLMRCILESREFSTTGSRSSSFWIPTQGARWWTRGTKCAYYNTCWGNVGVHLTASHTDATERILFWLPKKPWNVIFRQKKWFSEIMHNVFYIFVLQWWNQVDRRCYFDVNCKRNKNSKY